MGPKQQDAVEKELTATAADPDIQRELRQIAEEFRATEGNGLENSGCEGLS